MNYTSIEQSKRLLELGLNANTADMYYVLIDSDEEIYDIGFGNYIGILPHYPAWSLAALFELIPDECSLNKSDKVYWCNYQFYQTKDYDTPIDACFAMVCYLLENRYIKKGE